MRISLNNRHKAGLFLTTVAAGLCLILGENLHETLGAIFIGFALTWAFGSINRVLRICIGAIGFLILTVPFGAALIDHHNAVQNYEKSLESFRSKLPEFAKEHRDLAAGLPISLPPGAVLVPLPKHDPLACIGTPVPNSYAAYGGSVAKPQQLDMSTFQPLPNTYSHSRTLAVPNIGNIAFPCSMSGKDIAKELQTFPEKSRAPSWYLEALNADVSPDDIDQLSPPLDKPEAFDIKHEISDGAFVEIPSAMLAILFLGSVIAENKRFTNRFSRHVKS